MISVPFPGKPFNITVMQAYAPTTNGGEAQVEWFCEEIQDLLEVMPRKRYPFYHRGLEGKRGSQDIPWVTGKFSLGKQNEAGQRLTRVLPREHTGDSKHPFPTTQEMTLHIDITRWSIPKSDWLYSLQPEMQKLCTVSKTRMGADCASDHELFIVQFRLKLKKVGKTMMQYK